MFETLFKKPAAVARHRDGPLVTERERFLKECAQNGYAHSTLMKIAWVLLTVAPHVATEHGQFTANEIAQIVDRRRRVYRLSEPRKASRSTRDLFLHFTHLWLRSLDRVAEQEQTPAAFDAEIEEFTRYMRDERGLSPVTITTRCARLTWFLAALQPPHVSMDAIVLKDIDAFIATKRGQGWSRASLATLTSDLRSFFRYAEARQWCRPGLAAAIDAPRLYTREGLPEAPSWRDVQRVLAGPSGNGAANIRDHAILLLLALYGLRRGEVATLQLEDLDWDSECINVWRPKQRCRQRYPLLPVLGAALLRYLREIRPQCQHRALFLALTAPLRPLSAPSITAIAHARLTALGVTVSPRGAHCLRHACARHLLDSGFSLKQIGDHLGHRSAKATLNYTKVDLAGLREVAELDLRGLL